MANLDLAVIGNCSYAALIDERARIVWCCLPRFDGDPVFNCLLNGTGEEPEHGFFDIVLEGCVETEQRYLQNTPILVTTLRAKDGSALEIVDFAPRFRQHDRMFRPMTIVRHVRPVTGAPRIRVRCRPSFGYGSVKPQITRGSNHARWVDSDLAIRLTTNAAISYVLEETDFVVEVPFTLLLGPDESLVRPVAEASRLFYDATQRYWQDWTRSLSIPYEWQDAVIRAAMTLKLCHFEETGGIVAAITTSIPEAAGTQRNWDYRYCWLRDAYFVIHALNRLSATLTMENYLAFITNVVARADDHHLQPLYSLTLSERLVERAAPALAGYRGMGPVRIGNEAYRQVQNDVFGSVILATTQSFCDTRLTRPGDLTLFHRLEALGERAVQVYDKPDAGIWEYRGRTSVHTFSAVMCWAAADRLARIAGWLGADDRVRYWREHATTMRARILAEAWSERLGSMVSTFGGDYIDASLLLLHNLGFLAADDPRYVATVEAVERDLVVEGHAYRYRVSDDFGLPTTSFTVCTFWLIEALAAIGRTEHARELFECMLMCRNRHGLLSEDIDPQTGELWGNFPQTYSMVGLIACAMRLSKSWEEAF